MLLEGIFSSSAVTEIDVEEGSREMFVHLRANKERINNAVITGAHVYEMQ